MPQETPTGPIVRLRVKDGGGSRIYRLYGRGAQYCFVKDDATHTHVLDIPLAQWQANDYRIAKDVFSELRVQMVIPDFIPGESSDVYAGPEPSPENQELIADLEKQISELQATIADNQKLLDASAKRIEELMKEPTDRADQTDRTDLPKADEPPLTRGQRAAATRKANQAKKAASEGPPPSE